MHSLFSTAEGQELPWGLGDWRTCRVRLSSPKQDFPFRKHGPHSLHSPNSQCTKRRTRQWRKINRILPFSYCETHTCTLCSRTYWMRCLVALTFRNTLHWLLAWLKLLWADAVALTMKKIMTWHTPCTGVTVQAGLTVHWACCKDIAHMHAHLYYYPCEKLLMRQL